MDAERRFNQIETTISEIADLVKILAQRDIQGSQLLNSLTERIERVEQQVERNTQHIATLTQSQQIGIENQRSLAGSMQQ